MGRYLRALWLFCTGRFSAAANALQSNRYVMEGTFDRSIKKSAERFQQVKDAVASLMAIEQQRLQEISELHKREEVLNKIKTGSKAAMQRTINEMSAKGKTQAEIMASAEFIKHNGAYKDAASSLSEVEARISEKEADLKSRQEQVATYKSELQQMQRDQQALQQEKQETLADVAIAQQQQAINDVLAGISKDTVDKDLQSVREARQKAKASAAISADLAGNDARLAENEYVSLASNTEADQELKDLLDWGATADSNSTSKMDDAKLPE